MTGRKEMQRKERLRKKGKSFGGFEIGQSTCTDVCVLESEQRGYDIFSRIRHKPWYEKINDNEVIWNLVENS